MEDYQTPFTDNTAYGHTQLKVPHEQAVPTETEKRRREFASCLSVTAVVVAVSSLLVALVLGVIAMSRCSCDQTVSSVATPSVSSVNGPMNDGLPDWIGKFNETFNVTAETFRDFVIEELAKLSKTFEKMKATSILNQPVERTADRIRLVDEKEQCNKDTTGSVYLDTTFDQLLLCNGVNLRIAQLQDTMIGDSCQDLYNNGFSSSGVYTLRGSNKSFVYKAFCDMNGGWTLIMKIDGNNNTFRYGSNLWTNNETFNSQSLALDDRETKLMSYSELPFTELRLGMRQENTTRWITVQYNASSLHSVVADGQYRQLKEGRATWKSLIVHSSLQNYCKKEGFNAASGNRRHHRVRIGIIANNLRNCINADSRIGFGGAGTGCQKRADAANSCGNVAHCSDADRGTANLPVMGYILAR